MGVWYGRDLEHGNVKVVEDDRILMSVRDRRWGDDGGSPEDGGRRRWPTHYMLRCITSNRRSAPLQGLLLAQLARSHVTASSDRNGD